MIVVSDTSPIINLAIIGRLELLPKLFGEVILPKAVYEEIVINGKDEPGANEVSSAKWIRIEECKNITFVELLKAELDVGEAEAITLAIELHANALLMDEAKGREIASQNNINVLGLLGILLEAKQKGLIQSVKDEMDKLIHDAGFWVSKKIYNQVLKLSDE